MQKGNSRAGLPVSFRTHFPQNRSGSRIWVSPSHPKPTPVPENHTDSAKTPTRGLSSHPRWVSSESHCIHLTRSLPTPKIPPALNQRSACERQPSELGYQSLTALPNHLAPSYILFLRTGSLTCCASVSWILACSSLLGDFLVKHRAKTWAQHFDGCPMKGRLGWGKKVKGFFFLIY